MLILDAIMPGRSPSPFITGLPVGRTGASLGDSGRTAAGGGTACPAARVTDCSVGTVAGLTGAGEKHCRAAWLNRGGLARNRRGFDTRCNCFRGRCWNSRLLSHYFRPAATACHALAEICPEHPPHSTRFASWIAPFPMPGPSWASARRRALLGEYYLRFISVQFRRQHRHLFANRIQPRRLLSIVWGRCRLGSQSIDFTFCLDRTRYGDANMLWDGQLSRQDRLEPSVLAGHILPSSLRRRWVSLRDHLTFQIVAIALALS